MSGWRDEAHGTINGIKVAEDIDINSDDDDGNDEESRRRKQEEVFGAEGRGDAATRSSSRASSEAPTHPPSSSSEGGDVAMTTEDDDPFDVDALLAMEEEMNRERNAPPSKIKSGPAKGNTTISFAEDEDAIWAEMHGVEDFEDNALVNKGTTEQIVLPDPVAVARNSPSNRVQDSAGGGNADAEDMWDIIDEFEREQHKQSDPSGGENSVKGLTSAKAFCSNDTDWDDMYV